MSRSICLSDQNADKVVLLFLKDTISLLFGIHIPTGIEEMGWSAFTREWKNMKTVKSSKTFYNTHEIKHVVVRLYFFAALFIAIEILMLKRVLSSWNQTHFCEQKPFWILIWSMETNAKWTRAQWRGSHGIPLQVLWHCTGSPVYITTCCCSCNDMLCYHYTTVPAPWCYRQPSV